MWQKIKNIYHLINAYLACQINNNPSKKLTVIGVTGTDGKTTTSSMLYHILKSAGKKVAIISTVSAIIDDKEYNTGFHVSTPDSFALQSYIKKAVEKGAEFLVLEMTSHGLDQNRAFGVKFHIGIITNITHEHLDYHSTYEEYVKAKLRLLTKSDICIVNMDDNSYDSIIRLRSNLPNKKWITYGMTKKSTLNPHILPLQLHLPGEYNLYNAYAAAGAAGELGITDENIKKSLASFILPKGRFEVVYDEKFEVVIDFAHTPNAISKLLSSQKNKKGRIIHVFGSAGERDITKRPMMGEASAKYSDVIILTSEDPRGENVKKICEQIATGTLSVKEFNSENLHIIPERQSAINFALETAKEDDLVIITGKGHETTMNTGNGESPWSDQKAVKIALKRLNL